MPAIRPASGSAPQASPIENPDGGKETILIIDDEETIVLYAKETLKMAGYRVIGCTDPFHALEIYKRHKDSIALVILDYTLPVMNGAELFAELRAITPKIAVMLRSGFSEQQEVRDMLSAGLRGFLPKPYTRERLLAHVRAGIASSGSKNTSA